MLSRIILFLSRETARETWWYERAVIVAIEALCLFVTLAATPWGWPALVVAVRAPFHLRKAATDHAARSGAARKRELAEALRLEEAKLACAKELEHEALVGQVLSAANPFLDVIGALVVAKFAGKQLEVLALVGLLVSIVRFVLPIAYGTWRKAYRKTRPLDPEKTRAEQLAQLKSGAEQAVTRLFMRATSAEDRTKWLEREIAIVHGLLRDAQRAATTSADEQVEHLDKPIAIVAHKITTWRDDDALFEPIVSSAGIIGCTCGFVGRPSQLDGNDRGVPTCPKCGRWKARLVDGELLPLDFTDRIVGRIEPAMIVLNTPHVATMPGGTTVYLPANTKLAEQRDDAAGGA